MKKKLTRKGREKKEAYRIAQINAASAKRFGKLKALAMIPLFIMAGLLAITLVSGFEGHFLAQSGSAMIAFLPFLARVKYLSPEDPGGGGTESEMQKQEKLLSAIKLQVQELLKAEGADKDALSALKTQIAELEKKKSDPEGWKEFKEEHIKLMVDFKALSEQAASFTEKLGIKDQINTWITANKAALTNIKGGQKADLTPLVIKANSPMLPANTYNGSAYLPVPQFEAGITDIVRVQPTFWDYIKKGATNAAAYVWVNKKNPLGAAGFIGPGVAKPGISFEIGTEISNAKKIAVSEKCATELLEDIDGMASWIQQEIAYQLKQKVNTTLMVGVASSTVPAGIQTISVPYSLTTVKTTNPNHWDAIRACVAQLRSGNLMGPVTAFMNPVDYANMVLTKSQSQGQLFVPAETGATIVEDNNVPIGYVQVALLDYYKVLIYKDFAITFGWENDDFTKNLVTTIGEMRLHQFFSENHTGSFIYDTFDNIETAIRTV